MTSKMFLLTIVSSGFVLLTFAAVSTAENEAVEDLVIDERAMAAVQVDRAASTPARSSKSVEKRQVVDSLAFSPAKVPQDKTYYLMKNGKVDKKFKSGSSTPMTADCAQIKCPKSFDKDIVCWKCIER